MERKKRWFLLTLCVGIVLLLMMRVQAEASRESACLDGVTIVVDPGHGGKDNGAQKEDAKEQEINLAISLKLKAELEKQGATVILTRDGAYDLASDGATNRKREDMKKRAAIINEEHTDLFISVHLNAYPNVSIHGAHTFYRKNDEAGKALAEIMQKHLNALTDQEKTSKVGDYYILNETTPPGILVECGFLSNEKERNLLVTDSYQQRLAETLCAGILEYFNILTI